MEINSNKTLKQYFANELPKYLLKGGRVPVCPHFGECGGCAWQHLNYPVQIELKLAALKEIMKGVLPSELDLQVVQSPNEFEYRLRMDYVCSFDPYHEPLNRIGLRKRKNFNFVVDLGECHLIPPVWFSRIHGVYAKALELGLPMYDLVSGKGELRYLVARIFGEKAMLNIVTKSDLANKEIEALANYVLSTGFSSVRWLLNSGVNDSSFGDSISEYGEKYLKTAITLDAREVKLMIGPNTFFQNNIPQFTQLMKYVSDHAQSSETLFDLYCGVGTIGLLLANRFQQIFGIELEGESVDLAKENALANGVANITFFQGDTAEFMQTNTYSGIDPANTLAIVDPPRAGMQTKGVEEILKLVPHKVIYISCNPVTQRQDLDKLLTVYDLVDMRGFDMFPQTPHMENVVVLVKKS